jgi:hypothetical protein
MPSAPPSRLGAPPGSRQMKRRKQINRKPVTERSDPVLNPPGTLGQEIQAKIGDQLRALHDDIVKQGVPDRFADLLARLDKAKST